MGCGFRIKGSRRWGWVPTRSSVVAALPAPLASSVSPYGSPSPNSAHRHMLARAGTQPHLLVAARS